MTEEELRQRVAVAKKFMGALPFCHALDMRIDEAGISEAVMSMPYDPQIVGDPETGVVHGGAVSALMDTCCGFAVNLHPECVGATATIDLRMDYMRPARPEERIFAKAHVYKATRTVAFVRAIAYEDDPENPVATATGAFVFNKSSKAGKDKSADKSGAAA
ncbi:MAG: PaaI family thioesterase [Rhodobacteraceae bacterium]|nr:PaaI family thioesterase [Paracoccaceae bacterium]